MKKRNIPDKVYVVTTDKENISISIAARDRTSYDIAVRIFGFLFIFAVTIAFILDTPNIAFIIVFSLISMILIIQPLIISYLTLKETIEIVLTRNEIEIKKIRPAFPVSKKILKDKISYIELNRVTPNTEPFNTYLGFLSFINLFDYYIPYLGFTIEEPPMRLLQYHDKNTRHWIVKYLNDRLKQ